MAQIEPITWFRNAHPEQGSLRVQVSAAQGIFPIPGAAVEVYRDFGAVRETFYSGVTDSSGIADRILLPALPASLGLSSDTAGISGTALFAYAVLKGVRLGYLPKRMAAWAEKAFYGTCDRYLSKNPDGSLQLDGICLVAGLGGKDHRDGSLAYYFSEPVVCNDAKGVGPLVLAYTEMIARKK